MTDAPFSLPAEPPPLATQQSAALAEKPPRARKPSRTASTAADETPSKPSSTKSKTSESMNGQTGEDISGGLFDSQPEVNLKMASAGGPDAELDPYALPAETEKAARRLTMSPAARLGLSPLKGTSADAASGLNGVNASQGGPNQTDKAGSSLLREGKRAGPKSRVKVLGKGGSERKLEI